MGSGERFLAPPLSPHRYHGFAAHRVRGRRSPFLPAHGSDGAACPPSCAHSAWDPEAPTTTRRPGVRFGRVPLHFEANCGQTDPSVRFLARGHGYSLLLTETAAVFALTPQQNHGELAGTDSHRRGVFSTAAPTDLHTTSVRMCLRDANPHPHVRGVEEFPGKVNYLRGSDPAKWHTNVPIHSSYFTRRPVINSRDRSFTP